LDAASALNQEDLALLRALYGAGIPAIVLLSKADLIGPDDRVRMMNYIQEQIRRELGLELAVRMVSTVGADESLLIVWYEDELTPLLDRHRSLSEESVKRKIACLLESVIATLELLLAKRRGDGSDGRAGAGATEAQEVLNEADDAIRRVRESALSWSEGRRALAETIPRLVAQAVVSARHRAGDSVLAAVIEDVLLRRGQAAHDLVAGLQDQLVIILERLRVAAHLARADSSAIRSFHAGGLPHFDVDRLRNENSPRGPWWSGLAPPLAVWATERMIHDRLASTLTEVVSFHDRQLESWLKLKLARLVDLYEAQAGAFREQIRRALDDSAGAGVSADGGDLEADLLELRQTLAVGEAPAKEDNVVPRIKHG
jgi:hypothetical protein